MQSAEQELASTKADSKENTEQSTCLSSEESHSTCKGQDSVGPSSEGLPHPDPSGASMNDSIAQHTDQQVAMNSDQPSVFTNSTENIATNGTLPSTAAKSDETEGKAADSNVSAPELQASSELADSSRPTTDEAKPRERKRKSGWDTGTGGGLFLEFAHVLQGLNFASGSSSSVEFSVLSGRAKPAIDAAERCNTCRTSSPSNAIGPTGTAVIFRHRR
jgi:hypothetical protein